GEPEIGQTVLNSQVVRKIGDRAICLFIRNASRLSYDPQVLRLDLCQQISLCCEEKELPDPAAVNDAYLRIALFQLQRKVSRSRRYFFFVIDGLEHIPQAEIEIRSAILDLLPIGLPWFKFL